jgi:uncharacterized repeat protein (TIGR02543 family)
MKRKKSKSITVLAALWVLAGVFLLTGCKDLFHPGATDEAGVVIPIIPTPTPPAVTQYTVTYHENTGTGTPPPAQKVDIGTSVVVQSGSGLSKGNYVFTGWSDNQAGTGTPYSPGSSLTPTGDLLLYARWIDKEALYPVTYNANGGTGTLPADETVAVGTSITVGSGSGLSSEGYVFTGWRDNQAGNGTLYSAGSSLTVIQAVTLYAQWVLDDREYTVTYHANGGTGTPPAEETVRVGNSMTVKNEGGLRKSGCTFSGWNTLATGEGTPYSPGSSLTVTGDITLFAQWTDPRVQVTVTYDANGGTGTPGSSRVYAGENVTVPGAGGMSRSGYIFAGWNTIAGGGGAGYAEGSILTVTTSMTLYAQWSAVQSAYTVTYDANGGSGAPGSSTVTAGGTFTVSNGSIARSGYMFTGWNTRADGGGTSYIEGNSFIVNSNVTLYAQWSEVKPDYTVTYDANGGSGAPAPSTAAAGTSHRVSDTVPTRTNYTFTGWNTLANGGGTSYIEGNSFIVTSNVTLYAQWTEVKTTYTVTYYANGGTGTPPSAVTMDAGTSYTVLSGSSLSRTNYAFTGWNTSLNGGGTSYSPGETFPVNSNVSLYAQWTEVKTTYTVTYYANGGSGNPPESEPVKAGQNHTVRSGDGLNRPGYTFAGWNTQANGGGTPYAVGFTFAVNQEISLYAQWTAITYSIAYTPNSGTGTLTPISYTIESSTITLPTVTRDGYTFGGWYENSGFTGSPVTTMPAGSTGNKTYYAKWTATIYTITYIPNSGTGTLTPTSYTIESSTITLPTPSRTGCTFGGWYESSGFTGSPVTTIPTGSTGNKTYYAQWTVTITYDANTGSGSVAAQTVTVGSSITLASGSGLSKSWYIFGGWNTSQAGTGTNYAAGSSYTVTGNITLYAKWTAFPTLEMVQIPAGSFSMGQTNVATPVHTVTISKSFSMGKYEVTQAQFQAVMGQLPSSLQSSSTYGKGDNYPVYYVSWYDAIAYCNKLSIAKGLTPAYSVSGITDWAGLAYSSIPTSNNSTWNAASLVAGATGYRLPTEAEWEYACRAGTTTYWYTGNSEDAALKAAAWYWSTIPSQTSGQAGYGSQPVGTKTANAWGLCDMHGNVWEWCWDWYGSYSSGDQTDPTGAAAGSYRVVRGGSWINIASYLRSAYRSSYDPYYRSSDYGFRLVRP